MYYSSIREGAEAGGRGIVNNVPVAGIEPTPLVFEGDQSLSSRGLPRCAYRYTTATSIYNILII
jgi:hypothetical protein